MSLGQIELCPHEFDSPHSDPKIGRKDERMLITLHVLHFILSEILVSFSHEVA